MTPDPLHNLISLLSSLPGLGTRSARRAALYLLNKRAQHMIPLAEALRTAAETVRECSECGSFDMNDICAICRDGARDRNILCIVAQAGDVWAIERTGAFRGLYHVLGGVLSAIDGIGPAQLRLAGLKDRLKNLGVREVILALSATVDGQSTAHYIADELTGTGIAVTRLSHGMPMGGELDYLDDGTIMTALKARR